MISIGLMPTSTGGLGDQIALAPPVSKATLMVLFVR
jgi:hypothetical protein